MKNIFFLLLCALFLGCASVGPVVTTGDHGAVWKNRSATLKPGEKWVFDGQENAAWKFRHTETGIHGGVMVYPILDGQSGLDLARETGAIVGDNSSIEKKMIRGQQVFIVRGIKKSKEYDGRAVYSVSLISNGPYARYCVYTSTFHENMARDKGAMDGFVNSFTFE